MSIVNGMRLFSGGVRDQSTFPNLQEKGLNNVLYVYKMYKGEQIICGLMKKSPEVTDEEFRKDYFDCLYFQRGNDHKPIRFEKKKKDAEKLKITCHLEIEDPVERKKAYQKEYLKVKRELAKKASTTEPACQREGSLESLRTAKLCEQESVKSVSTPYGRSGEAAKSAPIEDPSDFLIPV